MKNDLQKGHDRLHNRNVKKQVEQYQNVNLKFINLWRRKRQLTCKNHAFTILPTFFGTLLLGKKTVPFTPSRYKSTVMVSNYYYRTLDILRRNLVGFIKQQM